MADPDGIFLFIGTYPSEEVAREDYGVVKALHESGFVGSFDAAVLTKDASGKVHVNKDEMATRHGGWGGAAAGAMVGILFPPAVIASALIGGAIGGVSGHLWRGLSRSDVRELGELIDAGEAALLVIGATTLEDALSKIEMRAERQISKELKASSKDVDEAVKDAAAKAG
ncbi:MAG TPA: DUF1269 domain-containing protein [Microthrixaceae bacterium]|nr:DUF1269 domain-containing protein [Microthrixaceae bacterium]